MTRIESAHRLAQHLEAASHPTLVLAVVLYGLVLAAGLSAIGPSTAIPSSAPTAAAEPRARASDDLARWPVARTLTVARPAPSAPTPGPSVQPGAPDVDVPVAEAVRAHGLLAALLSLEADGDMTETSEGLESIASSSAVAAELSGAAQPVLTEMPGLPRMGGRLVAAPAGTLPTDGAPEVSSDDRPVTKTQLNG